MKKIGSRIFVIFILVSTDSFMAMAQEAPFDLEIYKNFIAANKDISPLDLHKLYPSDLFKKSVTPFAEQDVLYLNEVISAYDLTDDEMELIKNNGFAVTERLRLGSYYWLSIILTLAPSTKIQPTSLSILETQFS